MAEQDSNDIVIQLPWVVPQQPSVQTIVLQQPAKTHLELNASTDKTAISSFALSVVIALILGCLATWLAYWYGRKSFDLTKQSFDAVIHQINAGMQEAQNIKDATIKQIEESALDANRNKDILIEQIKLSASTTVESNQQLATVQYDLKMSEIRAQRRMNLIDNLRDHFGVFFGVLDHQVHKTLGFAQKFYEENGSNTLPDEYCEDSWVAKELKELSYDRYLIRAALEKALLYLDLTNDSHLDVKVLALEIMIKFDEIGYLARKNKEVSTEKYSEFETGLNTLRENLAKILTLETEKAMKGQ